MTLLIFHDDFFSQNLKYLRKKRRLSQKDLAMQADLNIFWIRGVENQRYRAEISATDYRKLCKALHISPDVIGHGYLP